MDREQIIQWSRDAGFSVHDGVVTGGAVDLTLIDENGLTLNMGTDFNAEPLKTQNATYTAAQNISIEALRNRQLLMSVMSKAGFVNYPTEWWHWSYGDKYWALQTGNLEAIYDSIDENNVRI
jgi:D-alanyl-D-alanine dipeptidase